MVYEVELDRQRQVRSVWQVKANEQSGESKQDWATPPELIRAICKRLCIDGFSWDLAADEHNTVVPDIYGGGKRHFDIEDDALKQVWHELTGWLWLNPPFEDIEPWAEKAYWESRKGAHIAMLVPTSFAGWWANWVNDMAYIVHLQGRLKFVGAAQSYPKDCSLVFYTPWSFRGSELWDWKYE